MREKMIQKVFLLVLLFSALTTYAEICSWDENECRYDHVWWLEQQVFTPRHRFGALCTSNGFIVSGGRTVDSSYEKSTYTATLLDTESTFGFDIQPPLVFWEQIFPLSRMPYSEVHIAQAGTQVLALANDESNNVIVERYIANPDGHGVPLWVEVELTNVVEYPTPRRGFSGVLRRKTVGGIVQNQYYMFFGASVLGFLNDLWVFEQNAELSISSFDAYWRYIEEGPQYIQPRAGSCCAYFPATSTRSDFAVCFGGATKVGDLNDILIFNFTTEQFTRKEFGGYDAPDDVPSPRSYAVCSAAGSQFRVIFGHSSITSEPVVDNNFYVFNTITMTWETPSPQSEDIPTRSGGFMCKAFTGTSREGMYLLGGSGGDSLLNDIWHFDESTKTFKSPFGMSSKVVNRPPARAFHSAILKGTIMYIMFGRSSTQVFDDMWSIDLAGITRPWSEFAVSKMAWTKMYNEISVDRPSGRHSQAAALDGVNIYVSGGYLDVESKVATPELWSFNLDEEEWTLIFDGHEGYEAKAGHMMHTFFDPETLETYVIVVGGVLDHGVTDEVFLFRDESEMVDLPDSYVPLGELAYGTITRSTEDPLEAILVGGRTQNAPYSQIYRMTLDPTKDPPTIEWEKLDTDEDMTPTDERDIQRWGHVAATLGNSTIFCGGANSIDAGPYDERICYAYHAYEEAYYIMNVSYGIELSYMQYASLGATMIPFGDKLFVFGGQLITSTQIRDEFVDALRFMTFWAQCDDYPYTGGSDENCMHCAPGSLNPDVAPMDKVEWWQQSAEGCQLAPEGFYAAQSYYPPQGCGGGFDNNFIGATLAMDCFYCPAGTFSSETQLRCNDCGEDSFCPIGASKNVPLSDIEVSDDHPKHVVNVTETQPSSEATLEVPIFIITILASVGGVVIFGLIALLLMKMFSDRRRRKYYFDQKTLDDLHEIFDKLAVPGFGLDAACLFNALAHPKLEVKNLTLDYVNDLFKQNDADGSGYQDFNEFLDILMNLMEEKRMPLIAWSDTRAAAAGEPLDMEKLNAYRRFLYSLRFSGVDKYKANHQIGKNGDPLRIQQNNIGGIMTIVFILLVLFIVLALLIVFYYMNFTETTSLIPSVVVKDRISGDIRVVARVVMDYTFEENECMYLDEHNVPRCAGDGVQISETSPLKIGSSDTTCRWIYHDYLPVCEMTWWCGDCTLPFGTETTILMRMKGSGSRIVVDVEVTTGMSTPFVSKLIVHYQGRPLSSTVRVPFTPPLMEELRGDPPSRMTVQLTPTLFRGPADVINLDEDRVTGYLASIIEGSNVTGRTVTNKDYAQFSGVPVSVKFKTAENVIVVQRLLTQTVLDIISSLLGAVAGVGSGCLFVVQFFDDRAQKAREEEFEKAQEKLRAPDGEVGDGLGVSRTKSTIKQQEHDRDLLQGLLTARVNFHVATEELKLIRKVCSDMIAHPEETYPEIPEVEPTKPAAGEESK